MLVQVIPLFLLPEIILPPARLSRAPAAGLLDALFPVVTTVTAGILARSYGVHLGGA